MGAESNEKGVELGVEFWSFFENLIYSQRCRKIVHPTRGAIELIFRDIFQALRSFSPPPDQRFPLRFPFCAASQREQR